jgi:hypothetical protein
MTKNLLTSLAVAIGQKQFIRVATSDSIKAETKKLRLYFQFTQEYAVDSNEVKL